MTHLADQLDSLVLSATELKVLTDWDDRLIEEWLNIFRNINAIVTVIDDGTDLQLHLDDLANPHQVTKAQVGLSNVDNTADLDKPISTATQAALDAQAVTDQKLEQLIYAW